MLLRGQFKEHHLHSAGCSSPYSIKKSETLKVFGRQLTHKAVHTYAKSDTKPPFARSISTYRVVFQPPGLKSDILHENSLTYRQQPFTSSHIIAFPADQSRRGILINIPCSHASIIIQYIPRFCKRYFVFLVENFYEVFGLFLFILHNSLSAARGKPIYSALQALLSQMLCILKLYHL